MLLLLVCCFKSRRKARPDRQKPWTHLSSLIRSFFLPLIITDDDEAKDPRSNPFFSLPCLHVFRLILFCLKKTPYLYYSITRWRCFWNIQKDTHTHINKQTKLSTPFIHAGSPFPTVKTMLNYPRVYSTWSYYYAFLLLLFLVSHSCECREIPTPTQNTNAIYFEFTQFNFNFYWSFKKKQPVLIDWVVHLQKNFLSSW